MRRKRGRPRKVPKTLKDYKNALKRIERENRKIQMLLDEERKRELLKKRELAIQKEIEEEIEYNLKLFKPDEKAIFYLLNRYDNAATRGEAIKKILRGRNAVVTYAVFIGDSYDLRTVTLNETWIERLVNASSIGSEIADAYYQVDLLPSTSDGTGINSLFMFDTVVTDVIIVGGVATMRERLGGKHFDYINNSHIDLTDYQIYRQYDTEEQHKHGHINCLVYTIQSALNIKIPSSLIKHSFVPRKELKKIADFLEIRIRLGYYLNNGKSKYVYYGKASEPVVNIGLYKSHYFVNKTVTGLKCNSLNLIHRLFKEGKFQKMSRIVKTRTFYDENTVLDNELQSRPVIKGKRKKKKSNIIYFTDTEASTNNRYHKAFCISTTKYDRNTGELSKSKSYCNVILFLEDLPEQSLVIYHNLRYDFAFIAKHVRILYSIMKGNTVYKFICKYKKRKIYFIDSAKMVPRKLKDFSGMFGLKTEKAPFPYNAYTDRNTSLRILPIEDLKDKDFKEKFSELVVKDKYYKNVILPISSAKENLSARDFKKFMGTLDKHPEWKMGDKYFKHLEYAKYYCELDTKLLAEGMLVFAKLIKEKFFGLDIFDYLSVSSLAHDIVKESGAYDGVHELLGFVREYVQKSVDGGVVATRFNNRYYIANIKMQDFDACSLYPSAMCRCRFPIGKPKKMEHDMTRNCLKFEHNDNNFYYVVEIKLLKIGKRLPFPKMSYKNKIGTKVYSDDINDYKGKTLYVDMIKLEDLINFHQIEYEFVTGIYWDQGFNEKIQDIIKNLYDLRNTYKKNKNALESVIKLLMNSIYGKTILKFIATSWKFIGEEIQDYINSNIDTIQEIIPMGKNTKIKHIKTVDDHANMAHVGGMILSMSKRIMNEVMCLAHDNGIKIFYQDTDSMHIPEFQIPLLQKVFKEKYGRELIGNGLGQFHSDFKLAGAKKGDEIWSDLCIINGKKNYMDRLRSTSGASGYHLRMKGVSQESLKKDPIKKYTELFNGLPVEFEMPMKFRYEKNCDVFTFRDKFIRKVQTLDGKMIKINEVF